MRTHRLRFSPDSPPAATTAPAASLWILSWWQDLLLFVATPLLILPLFFVVRAHWNPRDLALVVVTLGGFGHHLPGMMRAYGDRALFERFKVRFIVAPVLLVATCALWSWWELRALNLVVLFWGLWHSLAQTYGFLRIYDSKVGSFSPGTARLDRAMCFVWFCGGALFSDPRAADILGAFYAAGGSIVTPSVFALLREAWVVILAVTSVIYVAHALNARRQGHGPSAVKLLLLTISISFWWFCMARFQHVIIGLALFEIFHDSQYLGIVWVFHRARLEKNPGIRGFTHFLFRRNALLMLLYVGLVLAYGTLSFVVSGAVADATWRRVLLGSLLASTLLHYYYDGFIWRVRESSTRESLGVGGPAAMTGSTLSALRLRWNHLAMWSLFVVPLVGLSLAQTRTHRPELQWRQAVVDAVPGSAVARSGLAGILAGAGNLEDATRQYEAAVQLEPRDPKLLNNLGDALARQDRLDEAALWFERVVQTQPENLVAHVNLGNIRARQEQWGAATLEFERALEIDPNHARARSNLAYTLNQQGRFAAAAREYEQVLRLTPDDSEARENLQRIRDTISRTP